MKEADFICPGCGSYFKLTFKLVDDKTKKEVKLSSIDCPVCHEYNLTPYGEVIGVR